MTSFVPRRVGSVMTRRDFWKWGVLAGASAYLPEWSPPTFAQPVSDKWLTIESIDRVTLEVPFREIPARAMAKEIPHCATGVVCISVATASTTSS